MTNPMEEKIKKLFRIDLRADVHAIQMTLLENGNQMTPELSARMRRIKAMQEAIDSFYNLLNENERFVVKRHFVDGVDWDCLLTEMARQWGEANMRSKRSLINYQNRAFQKMARYVAENRNVFDFGWLENL